MHRFNINALPPLAKLGVWLGLTFALSCAAQLVAWVFQSDFSVIHSSGVVMALALASLFVLIAADGRKPEEFGFFVGPVWKKLVLQGIAIGAGAHVVMLIVAWSQDVLVLRDTVPSAKIIGKALLNGMTALPLAATQQILFTGYLLTILRDRHKAITAVVISAALFAVLGRLDNLEMLLQPRTLQLMTCYFLVATLLGLLRLQTGSIVTSIGILAGWVFIQRVARRASLFEFQSDAAMAWLAPYGDPRRSVVFWGLLTVAIGWSLVMLRRHGEQKISLEGPAIDEDFKRVFPLSNSQALAPLDVWLGRLWHAHFRVGVDYLPRLIASLVMSAANTVITLPERLLLPWVLKNRQVKPPVFILGTHRSGTTHLHNLLALDKQFCPPRTYHMFNPIGCLFSGWLITPILGLFVNGKRPMDGVRFHLFTPQEEEFALASSGAMSVYWGATFPKQWPHYEQYMFPSRMSAADRTKWQGAYHFFLQKLVFWTGRTPLLKNPYNTGRMDVLGEMYPGAKFIHIRRHPQVVYLSNLHMSRQAHVMCQVQDPDPECSYPTRFMDNYLAMENAYSEAAADMPASSLCEICFEDLESDPIGVVQQIYKQLGLEYTADFDTRIRAYQASLSDYRKNRHRELVGEERDQVATKLGPLMAKWGYSMEDTKKVA